METGHRSGPFRWVCGVPDNGCVETLDVASAAPFRAPAAGVSDAVVPVTRLGQIVTFIDLHADTVSPFQRAVATGDVVDDPMTGRHWIPVIGSDLALTLVDPAMVVDVTPSSAADARFPLAG
jgi:hypothetical protein